MSKNFTFDLSEVGVIAPKDLAALLASQIANAIDEDCVRQSHLHADVTTMASGLLISELTFIMVAKHGGQWNQPLFSKIGNAMKEHVEGNLALYREKFGEQQ